jgi:phage gpG-like protein
LVSEILQYTYDYADVERGLAAMIHAGKDRAALSALAKPMKKDQRAHGRESLGPEGKWKAHAPSTRLRDRTGGKRLRARKGRLLGSLPLRSVTVKVTGDELIAFSKVPWAGIHQHGGTAGRGAKIPAREFLWLSETFFSEATEILHDRIMDGWGKGR